MVFMPGTIIKKDKNKYFVRLYIGLENGKRKYHSKTIHGTKKDAERYLNKILVQRDTTGFIEPSKELLETYLKRWLEVVVKQRVAPKTYEGYIDYVNGYLIPGLGKVTISKLDPLQIQVFYNSMLDKGLSPRTVRYAHSILRNALNQAVKWGILYKNPTLFVDLPKNKKNEMRVLNEQEAERFVNALVYSPWKALFSLLITTGMRPGEALGLKWQDIDFSKKRVQVRRSLSRTKGNWSLNEPKTSQSKRSIPIPIEVVKDLKEHQEKQEREKSKAKKYIENELVFAGKTGEPPDYRNICDRHFKKILEDENLPQIRLYDLRHTCATLLLSAGVNSKIVSERLGHASVTMTLDTYSHVLPDMQDKATAELGKVLFKQRNNNSHTIRTPDKK